MKPLRYGTLLMMTFGALLILAPIAGAVKDEMGFVIVNPQDVVWKDVPGYSGLKIAVIEGDPSKEGIYVIRVKFPPGVMTRPHFHPEDRHAIVISGTWYAGEGDAFDPDKTVALKPGSYMKHPAKGHHYDGAKDEEAVLQIIGYGPSKTIFIDSHEGPTGSSVTKK